MSTMRKSPKSWKKSGHVEGGYDAGKNKAYYGSGSPQDNPTVPRQSKPAHQTGQMQKARRKKGRVVSVNAAAVKSEQSPSYVSKARGTISSIGGHLSPILQRINQSAPDVSGGFGGGIGAPAAGFGMPTFATPDVWMMGPFGPQQAKNEPVKRKKRRKTQVSQQPRDESWESGGIPSHVRQWMF